MDEPKPIATCVILSLPHIPSHSTSGIMANLTDVIAFFFSFPTSPSFFGKSISLWGGGGGFALCNIKWERKRERASRNNPLIVFWFRNCGTGLTGWRWSAETGGDRRRQRRGRWRTFQTPKWRPKVSTEGPPIPVDGFPSRRRPLAARFRPSNCCSNWAPSRSPAVDRSQSPNSTSSSPAKLRGRGVEFIVFNVSCLSSILLIDTNRSKATVRRDSRKFHCQLYIHFSERIIKGMREGGSLVFFIFTFLLRRQTSTARRSSPLQREREKGKRIERKERRNYTSLLVVGNLKRERRRAVGISSLSPWKHKESCHHLRNRRRRPSTRRRYLLRAVFFHFNCPLSLSARPHRTGSDL